MKRLVASTINALFVAVLLLAGNAYGQYLGHVIKVKVPFAFDVADKTFPAGDYSLLQTAPYLISLRDSEGHVLANVLTGSVERAESHGPAKLDFYVDGDRHVLARVWQEHESFGHQVSSSKRSTYLARRRNTRIQAAAEGSQP
jgi:hypothetical protein